MGILAEQDPGEAPLALDLFEHLRPQPAYVGHRQSSLAWILRRAGWRSVLGLPQLARRCRPTAAG